jgi:inner membrane protein
MLLFGHIGITVGVAVMISGLVSSTRKDKATNNHQSQSFLGKDYPNNKRKSFFLANWFESLFNFVDIRLLVVGSILPDIIDKPLGMLLLNNGRTYAHTLIVTLIVIIVGFYLYKSRKSIWLLTLSAGMFSHLILDQMWWSPHTFLWPLFTWGFPRGPETNWLTIWLSALIHDPETYISEVIGILIIIGIAWLLIGKRKLLNLILKGKVG